MIVELKPTDNIELESAMTPDRIVEVKFGICNLDDKEFTISEDMIERVIDAN